MTKASMGWMGLSVVVGMAAATGAMGGFNPTWTPYRTGNTGIQGDYVEAMWVAPDGDPWICGYTPFQEEGGLAKFVQGENRWINVSNVDYPIIGSRDDVGAARVSEVLPDGNGKLWVATWRALLRFDPAVGPSSFERWSPSNSPLPGGRVVDIAQAPDGSLWVAALSVTWGFGGLARFEPATNQWTVWDFGSSANGWPGWASVEHVSVQPDATGPGYTVWVSDVSRVLSFHNGVFTQQDALSVGIAGDDAVDDAGNQWFVRQVPQSLQFRLEYLRTDGVMVVPPQPPVSGLNVSAFKAYGQGEALVGSFSGQNYRFDGAQWIDLGQWHSNFVSAFGVDAGGTVWSGGIGGAAKHLGDTAWQRYRVTNTSLMGDFNNGLSVDPDTGELYVCANAGTGYGGFVKFDGTRWTTWCSGGGDYGLGHTFPFSSDNSSAVLARPSGRAAVAPMFGGVREWDGTGFSTITPSGDYDVLREDSLGRLWGLFANGGYARLDGPTPVTYAITGPTASLERDPERPGAVVACAWFTVERNDGVTRTAWQSSMFPMLNTQHDGLLGAYPVAGGFIWIGTTNGLIRLNTNDNTFQHLTTQNSSIPADHAKLLTVTPDGRVWWVSQHPTSPLDSFVVSYDGTTFTQYSMTNSPLPHWQVESASWRTLPGGGYELWLACASRGIVKLTVDGGACPGDANGDRVVNFADLNIVLSEFGQSGSGLQGDVTGDGIVNFADLNLVLSNFGVTC